MRTTRRELLALTSALAAGALAAPRAAAAPGMGTLVDYSGGVPGAQAIRDAGHLGAIRYVSDRRPGAEWMAGKPLLAREASDLKAAGLQVVSCYQFGKGATADWKGGFDAGVRHARRGQELHRAAGGPDNRPIYASIDDSPTAAQFESQIAKYLAGWQSVVGKENTGVYANVPTIEWARAAGLGAWYWQHDWGSKGVVHQAANLHQLPRASGRVIDGIPVDINQVLTPDFGQWWR
ncbi:MAG: DUF1906 domain-containing protein [Mycobacteriaceae bacterium]|nr:DUF1906 domain-containing protein [Mycobacteriaceae bacterium]